MRGGWKWRIERTDSLKVRVQNTSDEPVPGAQVEIVDPKNQTAAAKLPYNERQRAFTSDIAIGAERTLRVSAEGYEPQERAVSTTGPREEIFVLGSPGMRYYYRGKVKVPFDPRPELVAIKLKQHDTRIPDDLAAVVNQRNLREYPETPQQALQDGVRVYEVVAAVRGGVKIDHGKADEGPVVAK